MKVFRAFEKHVSYALTRPDPTQSPSSLQSYGINLRTIPIYIMSALVWISLLCFLYDGVETLEEYSITIYALTTVAGITILLRLFEWKRKEMFRLIDEFEKIIEARKLETSFKNYYEKIP